MMMMMIIIIIIINNMTYMEQAFSRRVNECLVSDPYALKNQLNYCEFRGKIIIIIIITIIINRTVLGKLL